MQKKNIFQKKLSKSVLSVTNRIESFFNFFRDNFFNRKKNNLKNIDKRIILAVGTIFIFIITYFLMPSFYDQNTVKSKIESQILSKYNLEVKFDKSLRYGLLPTPHFYSENTIINYKTKKIAQSTNTKISIFVDNFFSPDNLIIKDLIFKNTDFKVDSSNFKFFINLLNDNKSDQKIKFLNSKLFYLNKNEDIIFLTDIKILEYFYEEVSLQKLNSKFNIFNIPISLYVDHDLKKNQITTEIDSKRLRLNIKNDSNYDNEKLGGQLDVSIINDIKKFNYILKKNSLKFSTNDEEIIGDINIKPFFLSSDLRLSRINLKKVFRENSVLENLLNSEILNNKNLNGKINFTIDNVEGVNFLDKVKFDVILEEGDIFISNLKTTFKESVIINLNDVQLIINENNLTLAGYVNLNFIDATEFYSHYQLNRADRKNIKKINFSFLFNFSDKFVEINNIKVNEKTNKNLEKFINNFNLKRENIFNKIVIRNSIKSFFQNF